MNENETLMDCFVKSSNKAFGFIFSTLDLSNYINFLKILGVEENINIDDMFYEKFTPLKLTKPQTITLSYGYGKKFTPLQFMYILCNAITGTKKSFHIIKSMKNSFNESIHKPYNKTIKILDEEVINNFHKAFDKLGKSSEPLYKLGANSKTGTVKLLVNGKYSENLINTFLITEYKDYIFFTSIGNPKTNKRGISHYYTRPLQIKIIEDIDEYEKNKKNK